MAMDICEHILLVLTAILSDLNLHKEFEHLLSAIQPLLNGINGDYQQWNRNVGSGIASLPVTDAYDNLSGNTIAATLVENLNNIELIQIPTILTDTDCGSGDGVGGGSDENAERITGSIFNLSQQVDMENLPIAVESDQTAATIDVVNQLNCVERTGNQQLPDGMELVHYRVELMDQFKMQTDDTNTTVVQRSDVCSSDTLATDNGSLGIEGIYEIGTDPNRNTDIVLSYLYPDDLSIDDLPMEIMDSFERPISSTNNDVSLLLANYNSNDFNIGDYGVGGGDAAGDNDDGCTEHERICRGLDASQLDAYINWLGSVIETTNLVLDFNGDGHPQPLVFSVPHVIILLKSKNSFKIDLFTVPFLFSRVKFQFYFDIFRTKFSAGTKKKRLPNQTTVITDGKYKNLTMFTWIFSNIKLIKYILSTKIVSFFIEDAIVLWCDTKHYNTNIVLFIEFLHFQIELEVVRSFQRTMHNTFEYINANEMDKTDESFAGANGNNRKIRPTTYKTFLKVKSLDKVRVN